MYADYDVFHNVASPNGLGRDREGIESVQLVLRSFEDAEENIVLIGQSVSTQITSGSKRAVIGVKILFTLTHGTVAYYYYLLYLNATSSNK